MCFNVKFMTHMIYNYSSRALFVSDFFNTNHDNHGNYHCAEYDVLQLNNLGEVSQKRTKTLKWMQRVLLAQLNKITSCFHIMIQDMILWLFSFFLLHYNYVLIKFINSTKENGIHSSERFTISFFCFNYIKNFNFLNLIKCH